MRTTEAIRNHMKVPKCSAWLPSNSCQKQSLNVTDGDYTIGSLFVIQLPKRRDLFSNQAIGTLVITLNVYIPKHSISKLLVWPLDYTTNAINVFVLVS